MRYDLNNIKWQIVTEAPNEPTEDEELAPTDYGEMEEVDMEETSDEELSAEDYTDDDGTDMEAEGEEPTDGTDMEAEGEEPTDDTDMDDTGENEPSGNLNEEQPDNDDEQNDDNGKNKFLINDFIELYNRLEEIIRRITEDKGARRNDPRYVQGKNNLEKIKDVVYDYLTLRFERESYVFNLYQFNLIIQAINVNMNLLANANKIAKKR